jgi:SAM-dependent methyltransferase
MREQTRPKVKNHDSQARVSDMQLKARWPDLYDCIDPDRVSEDHFRDLEDRASRAIDFDSISKGGRGELYRRAQANPLVRKVGISQLFELVSPMKDLKNLTSWHKILDVLGGDGALARALRLLMPAASMPSVLISDISEEMVAAARSYDLFAIRQAAQNLLLKDESLDGVVLAYGTHHIPQNQRMQACREGWRVLKPGRCLVFHDFETGSKVSKWFGEVVDRYSLTGHNFPHVTGEEIIEYISGAGFEDVKVKYLYDPFIVLGDSFEEAKREITEYVLNMYGLVKLVDELGYDEAVGRVFELMCEYFQYDYKQMSLNESFGASRVEISKVGNQWKAEVPRVALVGYADKPLH